MHALTNIILKSVILNFKEKLLILFFFTSLPASSQTYNFRALDENTGLTEKYINQISQSKDGLLLLSSSEGMLSFDGTDFVRIEDKKSLNDEFISTHLSSTTGQIYIGTQSGSLYEIISNDSAVLIGKTDFPVTSIIEIEKNIFIVGTKGNGLWIMDNGIFKKTKSVTSTIINDLKYSNDIVYVFGDNGIEICTVSNKNISGAKSIEQFNSKNAVSSCFVTGNSMLVAIEDEGFFFLDDISNNFTVTHLKEISGFLTAKITSIMKSRTGDIWISSRGSGLLKLRNFSNSNKVALEHINSSGGLTSDNVERIYEDNEGGLWFGMYGSGLVYLADQTTSKVQVTANQTGTDNVVLSVEHFFNDQYVIGTNKGLYSYYSNIRKLIPFKTNTLTNEAINCLHLDRDSVLWIGTENKGLFAYDKSKNVLIPKSGTNKTIKSITSDKKGNLYVGTIEGIYVFDRDRKNTFIYTTNKGLACNSITKLYCDSKNRLWVTCPQSGLQCIEDGDIKLYTDIPGLKTYNITSVYEDLNHDIWFCTMGDGVFKFKDTAFIQYTIQKGLTSNFCYGIEKSGNENMLVFHKNAYSTFKLAGDYFISSPKHENDFIGEISQNAVCYDPNFGLLIGTQNGFIIKQNKTHHFKNPQLVINRFTINGIKQAVNENLTLSYNNDYEFDINFSGICYPAPEKIMYKYRLLGYDNNWNTADYKSKTINYKKLPYGDYVFQIEALLNNDTSSPMKEIKFTILKPFWITWWFIVLSFAALAAIVIFYTNFKTKALKIQKRILDETVKERTLELQVKNTTLETTQHELAEKNKDITDSIVFAKRIQEAILPTNTYLKEGFEKQFILYMPRDIVSGDFYWQYIDKDRIYFTVADCMGHGVPGAFMSLIAIESLNKLVYKLKNFSPHDLVSELDKEMIASLKQMDNETDDSVDLAIIELNRNTNQLKFCGAQRGIIHVRDFSISEYKGDKLSVGGFNSGKEKSFTTKDINLLKNDMIYLFSDGFADQFGTDNKKYTTKRLKNLLLEISNKEIEEQKIIIEKVIIDWKGTAPQTDDILISGIKI